jgi:hypothetical protein
MDRAADQMRGRLVPREQKQENHRHHLVAADLPAFLLHPHQLGDETLATMLAYGFKMVLQVAPHRQHIGDHAQETDDPGEARCAACPGGEFRPVGKRETEQLADHRQRQRARIAIDKVGRTALREQLARELVGDRENARLHVADGTTTKGLVDNIPQPSVIRLVHRQHMIGEREQDPRHPPSETGDGAIVPADGEGFAVLQHPVGKILRGRRPNLADDREPHVNDRTRRTQFLDFRSGVAEIVLTGKVCAHD